MVSGHVHRTVPTRHPIPTCMSKRYAMGDVRDIGGERTPRAVSSRMRYSSAQQGLPLQLLEAFL
jgi:hypothetical protein